MILIGGFIRVDGDIKGVIFVDLDLIKAAAGDLALVPLEIEGNVAGDLGIGSIRACGCLLFLLDIVLVVPQHGVPAAVIPLEQLVAAAGVIIAGIFQFAGDKLIVQHIKALGQLNMDTVVVFLDRFGRDICDGKAAVQKLRNGGDVGILVFSAILALHLQSSEVIQCIQTFDGGNGTCVIFDFEIRRSNAVIGLLRICHRHQRCHLRSIQRDFSHLAIHIAGDHGQGAEIFVHIAHDANGAGIHGVFLNVGRGVGGGRSIHGEQGNVGIGGIILHLQRLAFRGHSLGHGAIVNDDITGHCGIRRQITVKIHGIAAAGLFVVQRAAQLAVQRQHAGNLRDSALGDIGIFQAVGKEHHVPWAVVVAVVVAVAGVVAHGLAVGIVQLEVALALLIAQLALGYGQQVVGPVAAQRGAGLCQPFVLVLRAVQRVGQAVHRVVMLRQAADQHFLVAGIGVVVHRGLDHRIDHHGLCGHRLLKQGHRVIIGVHFFYKLALFQTAHQLIGGGVAAVVVGVLEQLTDQAAVLRVKAVIGVLVLFFQAGQLPHFLIAVVGVLMGHKDVLRLCGIGCNAGIIRIHAERIIKRRAVVRHGGVPVLRFAFLIAAHQLLFIAGSGVLVLQLAAQIFGRFGNAHAVQLPVHEQAGGKRQCQQQRSIASGALVVPTELFLIFFHNIPHDS